MAKGSRILVLEGITCWYDMCGKSMKVTQFWQCSSFVWHTGKKDCHFLKFQTEYVMNLASKI